MSVALRMAAARAFARSLSWLHPKRRVAKGSARAGPEQRATRLLAFLALTAICSSTVTGGGLLFSASSAAQAIGDILRGRSPGERAESGLTMTKPAGVADIAALAALQSGGTLPGQGSTASLLPPDAADALAPGPESLARTSAVLPPFGLSETPPERGFFPGALLRPGIGGGLVGGGGGGGGPVAPPDGTLPAPPSPVPEPAAWLAMLTGMFAVGGALRLRARRSAGRSPTVRS